MSNLDLDDIDVLEDLLILRSLNNSNTRRGNREIFKSRKKYGFYNTGLEILKTKNSDLFMKSTRMSCEQFNVLLELVKSKLMRYSNRKPSNPEERLYITLHFLAHGCSMHTVSMKFRVGLETARSIILDTCDILWTELNEFYVSPPNEVDWLNTATKFFTETGVPNCIGALDGKHIRIKCPSLSGSQYFNYKKYNSIILLAVCDADYTFTLIDVGAYGSQSDGGVFRNSTFGRKLVNNELNVPRDANLPNTSVSMPYFLVADAAFPLKRNIMKPFARVTDAAKEQYNAKICSARIRMEIAFGILSSKWRILQTTMNCKPENGRKIVLTTIVLHNFLRFNASDVQENNINLLSVGGTHLNTQNASTREALSYRNILSNYFNNELN